jgi:hypothetical protein
MLRTHSLWPWSFLAVVLALLAAPAIAHRLFPSIPPTLAADLPRYAANEMLVGRKLGWTGFVVYPDGVALPAHIPAMHWSAFQSLIRRSGIEATYHSLLVNESVVPPFSVLLAKSVPYVNGVTYFVGPSDLLERREVKYWRAEHELLPHYQFPVWRRLRIKGRYP